MTGGLRVLSLTTTTWRSFYRTQVRALEGRGVEVTTRQPPGEFRAFDDGVRRRGVLDYLRFVPTVLREARHEHDLLHANYGLLAPHAAVQPTLPTVLTLWGGEFVGNRFAGVIRRFANRADEVVVPSEAMGERVARDYHVVPFPVDTDLFRPIPRAEARRRLEWEGSERVVLFPYATARYEKNYPLAERLVEALETDATLVAVSNRPHEELPLYMNASDALLITSRWESGPMVAKEAVACGLPVVSTDVGFVASVLDGISNSYVANTERELLARLETVLRRGERADGRHRIEDYGEREMAERLLAVYDRALDRGREASVQF